MTIDHKNFPAAFAAMDAAASTFWAYPDSEWQDAFLRDYAQETGDSVLLALLTDTDTN